MDLWGHGYSLAEDLTHKKKNMSLLKHIETLLNDAEEGWPLLSDFKKGNVFFDTSHIDKVASLLESNKKCVIRGHEGRGKTVLSRIMGHNSSTAGNHVFFVDVSDEPEGTVKGTLSAIRKIAEKNSPLFIIENAHAAEDMTHKLLSLADRSTASFIFTTREIYTDSWELELNPFEKWIAAGLNVDLKPDGEAIKNIINTFATANKLAAVTSEDARLVYEQIGTNLRWLRFYLETWLASRSAFSEISEEQMLRKVYRDVNEQIGNNSLIDMLGIVASVCQFDVAYYGSPAEISTLQSLSTMKTIKTVAHGQYKFQHSTDAALIVKAVSSAALRNHVEFTTEGLKQYLSRKPYNCFDMVKAVFESKQWEILRKLFEDTNVYNALLQKVNESDGIRDTVSFLSYLTRVLGESKGKRFWLQYRQSLGNTDDEQKAKLRNKVKFLGEFAFLLIALERLGELEKDWLIDILDEDMLHRMLDTGYSLASICNLLNECKSRRDDIRKVIVSKLNPEVMADRAKDYKSPQHIYWFLHHFLRENPDVHEHKAFLIRFLLRAKNEYLIEKLATTTSIFAKNFLRMVGRVDNTIRSELKEKVAILPIARSSITISKHEVNALWYQPTAAVQSYIAGVLSKGHDDIQKYYSSAKSRPIKHFGKLLRTANHPFFNIDRQEAAQLAKMLVECIDLRMKDKYDNAELSMLVRNISRVDENAYKALCSDILELNPMQEATKLSFDSGSASLLWDMYNYNPEYGRKWADIIFELNFKELLEISQPEAVSRLFFNLSNINASGVSAWIADMDMGKFISKAASSSTNAAFWMIWSLYKLDTEKSRRIVEPVAEKYDSAINASTAKDIPFLGLLAFFGVNVKQPPALPPHEIVNCFQGLPIIELAFSAYLLSRQNRLSDNFKAGLSRALFARYLHFSITGALARYQLPKELQNVLISLTLPEEPQSTFGKMVELTQKYCKENQKLSAAFTDIVNYFLGISEEYPIFGSETNAIRWINYAIDKEIYNASQANPFTKTSTVTLLALNPPAKL